MQLSVKGIADSANMIYECTCNFAVRASLRTFECVIEYNLVFERQFKITTMPENAGTVVIYCLSCFGISKLIHVPCPA